MSESAAGKQTLSKSSDKPPLFYFWKKDLLSGFLVSLIALPLCLGIAGASGFPPVMGVLTAIVGGMIVSWFAGSELTIKGPAAGLIVIVAGCVEELGHGDALRGWELTLGAIVVAGAIQVVLGRLKVAVLADFFPLSAVHGMLTAIGIIILAKQIHFALGIDPQLVKGKNPVELLLMIPESIKGMNYNIAIVGALSVLLMFGWMLVKNAWLKRIPPALLVLITGIVLGMYLGFEGADYAAIKPLVDPGEFTISYRADFSSLYGNDALVFWRYVLLFALIGSLESMLTGKAIDLIDPQKKKSDLDKDLSAVGVGNMVSGALGWIADDC
jgi:MFS superfamily sulfate permease-like transporter